MADFNNLPGTYVDIQDGNLGIIEANPAPVVAVLGTSEKGDTGVLTPVLRPADAVNAFGSSGTLIRGMYETRFGGSTNTVLYRVAAKPAKLLHVGDATGASGITLETVDKDNTAGNDLYVVWDDSEKHLWIFDTDDALVFEMLNDEILTDTGRVYGYNSAAATTGSDIEGGTPVLPVVPTTWENGELLSAITTTGTEYVAPTDGVDATAMELYEAMFAAYAELEAFDADFMVPMDVYMDTPNIADDSGLAVAASTTLVSVGGETSMELDKRVVVGTLQVLLDPLGAGVGVADYDYTLTRGTGTNDVDEITFAALTATDELRVSYYYLTDDALLYYRTWEEDGQTLFEWHNEKFKAAWDAGLTAWVTYEYHEANFAWQLANYCYNLTKNDNDCIGMIGVRPFRSTALKDLSDWTGFLPEKDSSGLIVTTNGGGLAGNKWMAGKLVDVVTFDFTSVADDLSAQIAASAGPFTPTNPDFLGGTLVVLADGLEVAVDQSLTTSTTFTLHEALGGGEATFDAYYYWEDSVSVLGGQFGPGFFATAEEVEDGTPLSPTTDIGRYISVVMSWPILFTPVDQTGFGYLATGAPIYGGFVSGIPPASAPTNKVIPDIQMPFRMSKTKMDDLVSVHYVLYAPRERGTIVVDAPTAATTESDYQRLTTIRIVAETIRRLREGLLPFIGEGLNSPQLQAMQTTADRICTDIIKDGLIQRYEASVSASAIERVQGKANLDLLLVPSFELRQIFVTISLSAI